MRLTRLFATASFLALLAAGGTVVAQERGEFTDAPALVTAEQIVHDREREVVTAIGSVEISQDERVLLADRVTYDLVRDVIYATGNVSLLEPTGEVFFADNFEITGDLKNGIARDLRLLLTDQSRMAAAVGRRIEGETTVLDRAVYSACEPCRDDPRRPLLWQVKALRVTHDQITKNIEYQDAWLEMLGVPVAYTPYFSHPDPTVERRSGFLAPTVGQGRNLGASIRIPYHYVISPSHDVTFSPMFTSEEGVVLSGDHRKLFTFGEMQTEASITNDSQGQVRGHILSAGRFDLTEHWRTGYELERSSDDTYLRRYGFGNQAFLTTRPYLEGFTKRSYALAEGYAFQGLRVTDHQGDIPVVLPHLQYSYVSDGSPTGRWRFDSSAVGIARGDGVDSRRVTVRPSWELPYVTRAGSLYTLNLSLRADVHHFENFGNENGTEGWLLPEASVTWRYPFVRPSGGIYQVIEPIAVAALSPQWHDADDVPNEDSLLTEFDDTTLFRPNTFTGFDRFESGPRVKYGVQWTAYAPGGGYASAVLGQSWRPYRDDAFLPGSGQDKHFSDIVGRLELRPNDLIDVLYRFRLDRQNWEPKRSDLALRVGPEALRLGVDYSYLSDLPVQETFEEVEEVVFSVSSAVTQHWSVGYYVRQDLTEPGGLIGQGAQAIYDDECFTFITSIADTRTAVEDDDNEEGVSIAVQLIFKTLGELPLDVF